MMMRRTAALLAVASLLSPVAVRAQPAPPKLVVVIVVDQMRRDYADDYGTRWTHGLRRILDEGARFTNAAYPYTTTITCAGHATISTGAYPSTHGIVSNSWWDRAGQRVTSCTSDASAREVPYGDREAHGGAGARLLEVPAFASALADSQQGKGRVVTLSIKAAAAAMLAGRRADAALWFQGTGFSSSTAYGDAPEPSILRYIQSHPIESDFGQSWSLMGKPSEYKYQDDAVGEKPPDEWDRVMPHRLQPRSGKPTTFFYEAWRESPYSDAYLERLAEAAIDGMKLGQGEGTDFLGISFSALDIVGHDFGPRSFEVQDLLLHLDETLGRLLDRLDKKVGRANYVLAFTADHGVAVIPEQAAADGLDAGRVKMGDIISRVDQVLTDAFGAGHWVATESYTEFYFRAGVFDRIAATPGLLDKVTQAVAGIPGVREVIDGRTLAAASHLDDPEAEAARLSYRAGRSGDLLILLKPNWIFVSDDKSLIPGNATTHGSPYPYDQRVPLVLLGHGVTGGTYPQASNPADIAPTLARLCGVALPTATGRVLEEALAPAPAPAR
jgi:predicted AlkP superfamily pyrophosphatase or phosphodiesterase